jgi:hypothetical protein
MNLFLKYALTLALYSMLIINKGYTDWTTVEFLKSDGTSIGKAEGADSWFLNAPAFKFNFKNLEPGTYRIALYDGTSCANYGASAEINNPKLKTWHTAKLLILEANEEGIFNTTLGIKPDVFNEDSRNLVSISTLRGYPLLLFKLNNNDLIACGIVPLHN